MTAILRARIAEHTTKYLLSLLNIRMPSRQIDVSKLYCCSTTCARNVRLARLARRIP